MQFPWRSRAVWKSFRFVVKARLSLSPWPSRRILSLIDEIRFISDKAISPQAHGFRSEILEAITRNYGEAPVNPATQSSNTANSETSQESPLEMEFVSSSARQANREAIEAVQAEINQKKTQAVRLASQVIQAAMKKGTSDIHIEPQATSTSVRLRVDGVLCELDKSLAACRTRSCRGSRSFPTWTSAKDAPRRRAGSW